MLLQYGFGEKKRKREREKDLELEGLTLSHTHNGLIKDCFSVVGVKEAAETFRYRVLRKLSEQWRRKLSSRRRSAGFNENRDQIFDFGGFSQQEFRVHWTSLSNYGFDKCLKVLKVEELLDSFLSKESKGFGQTIKGCYRLVKTIRRKR